MRIQVQCLSPSWLFEPCMLWMNSSPKAYDWALLGMEAQHSSPSKVNAWSSLKAKISQDASLPSATPSHFIVIKVQAYQVSSILNGPKRSKRPNFALLHIRFARSWLSLKFVCLFHVSLNSKISCSIWYTLFIKNQKKKRFLNLSPKKKKNGENFQNKF